MQRGRFASRRGSCRFPSVPVHGQRVERSKDLVAEAWRRMPSEDDMDRELASLLLEVDHVRLDAETFERSSQRAEIEVPRARWKVGSAALFVGIEEGPAGRH
jgi:hypothetical protein